MNLRNQIKRPYLVTVRNTLAQIKELDQKELVYGEPQYAEFNGDFTFIGELENMNLDIDEHNSIVFCTELTIKKQVRLLEIVGYDIVFEDATDLIYRNIVDVEGAEGDLRKGLYQYMKEKFDMNDILDKITQGLELTGFDKQLLQEATAQ